MIIINVVTSVCLALMTFGLVMVLIGLFSKRRAERIEYVRNYKKGKGALIYIYTIPLLWMGIVYSGASVFEGLLEAVPKAVNLIALKYELNAVSSLINDNGLYAFTLYYCYILVALNIVLFIFSLIGQYIWKFRRNFAFKRSHKEKLVVFGNNALSHAIYNSEKKRARIIADDIANIDALPLYMKDIAYDGILSQRDYVNKIVSEVVTERRRIFVILNTEDDDKNIALANDFICAMDGLEDGERDKCFGLLRVFVFGSPQFEGIYESLIKKGTGCLTYVNKYQKIAMDFIDKYPLTEFMTKDHVDYASSFIKSDVCINMLLVGFGETNRQVFLTSVANNQFIAQGERGAELKKVDYHIFDKEHADNDKNLNHDYNRYKNECLCVHLSDYLPLPDYPANEHFHCLDINEPSFYNGIRTIIEGGNKVNFVVIAFGTDLENVDMAQKILAKSKEWGIGNLTIFVKLRKAHKGIRIFDESNCFVLANEMEVVYNADNIISDKIFRMAQLRNQTYDLEYELTQSTDGKLSAERMNEIKRASQRNWYIKKTQLERDSNLYCCLSLRSKLQLMGLDYTPVDGDGEELDEAEYMEIYAGNDRPDYLGDLKADGKSVIKYTLDFPESRRKNMSIHEHLRWNSFMISRGVIPSTKKLIATEIKDGKYTNGKNYDVRRHGNLTTFEGLEEYRQIVAERDKRQDETLSQAEMRKDVIKYDYQLLDDAYWLLKSTGYKIIRKQRERG